MNGVTVRSNREGLSTSHLISFAGKGAEMALPNIKHFAERCVDGFDGADDETQEKALALVVSEAQPLTGLMVEVAARSIPTKEGKDFTKITYVGVVDDKWRVERGLISEQDYKLLHPDA